ncbi:MAG: UbiD family decarboxylase domain-containing protein [Planctomycetota bacterium]
MPYRCLADFLEELGHAGELARVDARLEHPLEAVALTRELASTGGPAAIFSSPQDTDVPLLTNMFGSLPRIARGLGRATLIEASEQLATVVGLMGAAGMNPPPLGTVPEPLWPRTVRGPACQQVVRLGRDVDLRRLPALPSHPCVEQRWLNGGIGVSIDPDSRRSVVEYCTLAVLGPNTFAAAWEPCGPLARLRFEYHDRRQKMPLAVVFGGDPAILLSTLAPWPQSFDPWEALGALRGKAIELAACRSVDLAVAADCEIVIEALLTPGARTSIGPVGLCDGSFSLPGAIPEFTVTALTHRANPVCPALVQLPPPNERSTIQQAMVEVLLPLLKRELPELTDLCLPGSAGGRNWAVAAIRKTTPWQARCTAHALWARRAAAQARWLVVVDESTEVRDAEAVAGAIAAHCRPDRDVITADSPPSLSDLLGGPESPALRCCLDATAKWSEEGRPSDAQSAALPLEVMRLVDQRWLQYGLGPRHE